VAESSASRSAGVHNVDDNSIASTIERELMLDPGVRVDLIDIRVSDGVAELAGSVDDILAKERARRITETVKGVSAVVNLIEVEPPMSLTNDEIRADVITALRADPATDKYELRVTVEDGEVVLGGAVEGWAERSLSETVAKGVPGVVSVDNQITVDYPEDVPDYEIRTAVQQRLHWDHLIDDGLIRVEVEDGTVTLAGTVGSASEKSRARRKAFVQGVKSVESSDLEVERWARDEDLRANKYVARPDSEIRDAIDDAFTFDPRVFSFDVDVQVANGMATLRGVVDNLKARRAAEQTANNTVGVYTVRNLIKVRPETDMTDEQIANQVEDALRRDPWVEAYEVTCDVDRGTARLYGTVDTGFERLRAEEAASKVNGIVAVTNKLQVHSTHPYTSSQWVDPWVPPHSPVWIGVGEAVTYKTDEAIERDIEDQIFWSPFVNTFEVDVGVENGVATLTGSVDSWSEWRAARRNAYEGGATKVINRLEIDPQDESVQSGGAK